MNSNLSSLYNALGHMQRIWGWLHLEKCLFLPHKLADKENACTSESCMRDVSLTWTNLQLLLCDFCEILSQGIFVLLIPSTFVTNKNIISLLTFWAKQTIVEHNTYIIHAKACRKIFNPFRIYVILLFPTEKQWYQCSESSWKIAQNACHLSVPSG